MQIKSNFWKEFTAVHRLNKHQYGVIELFVNKIFLNFKITYILTNFTGTYKLLVFNNYCYNIYTHWISTFFNRNYIFEPTSLSSDFINEVWGNHLIIYGVAHISLIDESFIISYFNY